MSKKEIIKDLIDRIEDEKSLNDILSFINDRNKLWVNKGGRIFFALSIISAFAFLFYLVSGYDTGKDLTPAKRNNSDFIIYAVWALATPAWFLLEYNWIFPDHLKFNASVNADFKYTQELSNKFWIALLVIFSSILYTQYIK
jgi:hypothetical protein